MRFTLVSLWFLFCYCGFAQLVVQEGTLLSLKNPNTVLSSYEELNQVNNSIKGEGTLYLNGLSDQLLTSTQNDLELPNLYIKNADLVHIQTALKIHDQLDVFSGQLTLYQKLIIKNPENLVLGNAASIFTTHRGQLVCGHQIVKKPSFEMILTQSFLIYTENIPIKILQNNQEIKPLWDSIFGPYAFIGHEIFFKPNTPPPKSSLI